MSKHINVNPDHYKVAGRERQGENVVHSVEKRAVTKLRREERQIAPVRTAAQPPTRRGKRSMATVKAKSQGHTGISNREPPETEARSRREHPPVGTSSPPPEDAAGRVGEHPLTDLRNRHTSHKAGSRSIALKEAEAQYPDRSMPAARKVAGAFGREPQRIAAIGADARGAMRRARPKGGAKARKKR